jgi:O-antigen ligase/tetratricopeptide (TPR) repeat protein
MRTNPFSAPASWRGAAQAVLVVYLVLVPVLFWRGALEPFEACKACLLYVAALLLAGCLVCARAWRGAVSWREPISLAVLLGVLSAGLSTIQSISPRTSLWGAWENHAGLLTAASLIVLFLATRAVVRHGDDVRPLVAALAVGTGLCAAYALVQTAGADPLGWVDVSGYGGFTRPIGMLGHPNYLAGFLVMALPLLVSQQARAPGLLLPAALGLLVVVAALSRAAWLAAAVLLVLPVVQGGRRGRLVAGALGLLLAAVAGLAWADLLGPLGLRIRHLADADTRLAIWRSGTHIFLDHPLTGCGLDTFGLAFARHRALEYGRLEWGVTPSRAHNDLLHILATQGLVGGLALLAQVVAVAVVARRAWRRDAQQRGLVLGLLGVVAAYHVQNLFGFPVIATSSLLAVALGSLSRLGESTEERCLAGASGSPRFALAVGTALACLVLPLNLLAEGTAMVRMWPAALLAGLAVLLVWLLWPLVGRETTGPVPCPTAHASRFLRPALTWPVVLGLAWLVAGCPFAAWCLLRRGEIVQASDPQQAVALQERAAALAPFLDVTHAHLASTCQRVALARGEAGGLHRAVAEATAACRLVPANALYHANHARMLADLARMGEGSRAAPWPIYDEAQVLDPRNLTFVADAAAAAVALGQYDQARRYLERGRALDPTWPRLLAEEGILALAEGRLGDAERGLCAALKGNWAGDVEALSRAQGLLALTYLQMGQSGAALAHADEVLKLPLAPSGIEPATRWVRATALERLGRVGEARAELQRVLALRPNHAAARAALDRLAQR